MDEMDEKVEINRAQDPLVCWRDRFGEEYIQRNQAGTEATSEAAIVFERILRTLDVRVEICSVLEVGANIGINLIGLRRVMGETVRLAALEPSPRACDQLRRIPDLNLDAVVEANAYHVPFQDQSYDLVFTNGVLIHIPPDRLAQAMREVVRVSRKYVLCSEYFSHTPVEVPYHGHVGMLWKRDFWLAYLEHCSELKIHHYGFLWQAEFPHFDDLNWWLFRKDHR